MPKNLLNNGVFFLVVNLSTIFPAMKHAEFQIEFEVEDENKLIARWNNKLGSHGFIKPQLKWENQELKK